MDDSKLRIHNHLFKALILSFMAFVIYWRHPQLFHDPRFWAEEATYFTQMRGKSFFEIFNFVSFGYYNLIANLGGFLASLLSLERAPAAPTFLAFAIQLLPYFIILTSDSKLWNQPSLRFLALLIVLLNPNSGDIWLFSLTSQYHLALTLFLILLIEPSSLNSIQKWFQRIIIGISTLSGILPCFLLPIYFYRWKKERHRSQNNPTLKNEVNSEIFLQFVIFLLGSLFQLFIVASQWFQHAAGTEARIHGFNLWTYIYIFFNHLVVMPFLGLNAALTLSRFLIPLEYVSKPLEIGISIVVGLCLLSVLIGLTRRCKDKYGTSILLALFFVFTFSLLGSLGDKHSLIGPYNAQRYFFVPTAIFLFLILGNFKLENQLWNKNQNFSRPDNYGKLHNKWNQMRTVIIGFLFMLYFFSNSVSFRESLQTIQRGPSWKKEVQQWRSDPTYILSIWPGTESTSEFKLVLTAEKPVK